MENAVSLILHAAAFAAEKHRHQRRKDKQLSPYINHPLALAHLLANEGGITDPVVICAALLHDTLEDTDTSAAELRGIFGEEITAVVLEVSDDTDLPKAERKRLQIAHAPHVSNAAKLVKLADKICNLRDIASSPPADWPRSRKDEYYAWAAQVVEGLRGTNARLETLFDEACASRP